MSKVDDAFRLACRELLRFPGQKTVTLLDMKAPDVDEDERTASTVISTEAVDRDREVVLTRGLKLTNYLKNPVVLWMHDMEKVVGKSLWVKKQDRASGIHRTVSKCQFAETALGEEVFRLTGDDFVRATSIGMHPFSARVRAPKGSEIKARPELAEARIIEYAELLEWSWVSIPSNPQALSTGFNKGIINETRPYYEPILKAITDANPRKKPFVRLVSGVPADKTFVRVVPAAKAVVRLVEKPLVAVTPAKIAKSVAQLVAARQGRV